MKVTRVNVRVIVPCIYEGMCCLDLNIAPTMCPPVTMVELSVKQQYLVSILYTIT